MNPTLHLLSGGAAQGLVGHFAPAFQARTGASVSGTFGAVGAMKDKLLGGAPCDVLILTQALIEGLEAEGRVRPGSAVPLGVVKTGVAVKAGEAALDVSTPQALAAALRAARGIYFPDPLKATAGIHFMKVLTTLGLDQELAPRLRAFPNGATAMREMAQCGESGLIGCTQVTEILYTAGVTLCGLLPKQFELATMYTAGVCSGAQWPEQAAAFIASMAAADAAAVRSHMGFEG